MKRLIHRLVLVAAATACSAALAGNDSPGNCGNGSGSGNACLPSGGQGGAGGAGGQGGDATAVGVGVGLAAAQANAAASAAAVQGQQQQQGQSQVAAGGTGLGTGGAATATGNGAGNTTQVAVAGDTVTYKAASAAAYAPDLPTVARSCRLYVGFGGASRDGSGSGGIPIGSDQTCLSGTSIDYMVAINRAAPGTFGQSDFLTVVCKVEGMAETAACRK